MLVRAKAFSGTSIVLFLGLGFRAFGARSRRVQGVANVSRLIPGRFGAAFRTVLSKSCLKSHDAALFFL